jgi:SAM-dependent methyltransferase
MRPDVSQRLLDVNRAFYQSLGEAFAASRTRPQPGVLRALASVGSETSVIDVGCGHGLAAAALDARGFSGRYTGVDGSAVLLELARRRQVRPWARFEQADLAAPGWSRQAAATADGRFDWALAFSVFHHFPGEALRLRLARDLHDLLGGGGRGWVSVWQFLESPRLRNRRVDWGEIGLDAAEVDPGDALLDWRRGGYGVRYVHHFSPEELADLATAAGFKVEATFLSDGDGGRMGLYQQWTVSDG